MQFGTAPVPLQLFPRSVPVTRFERFCLVGINDGSRTKFQRAALDKLSCCLIKTRIGGGMEVSAVRTKALNTVSGLFLSPKSWPINCVPGR